MKNEMQAQVVNVEVGQFSGAEELTSIELEMVAGGAAMTNDD